MKCLRTTLRSLIDKSGVGGGPVDELFGFEPKSDLLLRGFLGVGAVDDVATEIEAKVTADGTGQGSLRIGFSHHHSASLGGILALPHHWHHGTRRHEFAKPIVERLVLEIDVMLLEMLFGALHKLHSNEFESTLLESLDDITHKTPLNTVRLHHDESALRVSGHCFFVLVFSWRNEENEEILSFINLNKLKLLNYKLPS